MGKLFPLLFSFFFFFFFCTPAFTYPCCVYYLAPEGLWAVKRVPVIPIVQRIVWCVDQIEGKTSSAICCFLLITTQRNISWQLSWKQLWQHPARNMFLLH